MMRLVDWLLRWTGDPGYADYWERNLYNGILAQQHPDTGMVAYWLPLQPGSSKAWGTPTAHFWCCHGILVEAHTVNERSLYFEDGEGLVVCQYVPSELTWRRDGGEVHISLTANPQVDAAHRPSRRHVSCSYAVRRPRSLHSSCGCHGGCTASHRSR